MVPFIDPFILEIIIGFESREIPSECINVDLKRVLKLPEFLTQRCHVVKHIYVDTKQFFDVFLNSRTIKG
jgi:hypothetical protein